MSSLYLQAKAIAMEALELPASGREAWVASRCGEDEALQREALWLVAAARTEAGDEPVVSGPRFAQASAPLDPGAHIDAAQPGQYRILRVLGEGGMGTVYLAERSDGDTRQQVALKLLSGNAAWNARLAARMGEERRILALLDHPNIAHLVDGGVSGDGQPFIAMEYVRGERIDRWCEARGLPLRARLRLFLKVCAAVEHAHQRLVIHRDLKPANILVDAAGEPKLLDFGIARLVEDAGGADATRTAHRALTLAYASPEHVEGRALTTATDVWSLGIVLYELLAGVRPHQHAGSEHLLPGAIVSGRIRPPSTQLRAGTAAVTVGRIPADVDAIVLKALRVDPAQRYPSVAALAADIRLFLDRRPVSARRGHALYRLRRFCARHRWPLGAAAVLVVALGGYLVDRDIKLQQVTTERNKALALSKFMADLFANADPSRSRGEQVTVREVLDHGAVDLRERGDLSDGLRADLLLAVADAYIGLQLVESALPVLGDALRLMQVAKAPAVERADALARLANLHALRGDNLAAVAAAREGMALLSADRAGDFRAWIALRSHELRSLGLQGESAPAALVADFGQALAMLDANPDVGADLVRLTLLQGLANAHLQAGDAAQALRTQEQALAHAEARLADQPSHGLAVRGDLGAMLLDQNLEAGLAILEAVARDHVRLVGESTPSHAVLLNQIAVGHGRAGRIERSLAIQQQASEVAKATGPGNRLYLQLATTLGANLARHRRFEEAEALLREVLPSLEARSAPGVDAVNHAYAMGQLALTLLDAGGDAREALALARRAEDIVAPHATGGFMVVYDNAMRAHAQSQLRLHDREGAAATVARYRALLDAQGEPADSRWRAQADRLQASIAIR